MTLGALQFYGSRPSQLKKGVLHEWFTAVRGRLLFVAFEQEIYLELESDSTSVQEFLQSRAFEEPKSDDLLMASLYQAPFDWFPKNGQPGFTLYRYNNSDTEELYVAFIADDQSRIYTACLTY